MKLLLLLDEKGINRQYIRVLHKSDMYALLKRTESTKVVVFLKTRIKYLSQLIQCNDVSVFCKYLEFLQILQKRKTLTSNIVSLFISFTLFLHLGGTINDTRRIIGNVSIIEV